MDDQAVLQALPAPYLHQVPQTAPPRSNAPRPLRERTLEEVRGDLDTRPPDWLLRRREISQNAKLTYAVIRLHLMNGWRPPTFDGIAERIGSSEAAVKRAVKQLVDFALITSKRGGPGQPNTYKALQHGWIDEAECLRGQKRPHRKVTSDPIERSGGYPLVETVEEKLEEKLFSFGEEGSLQNPDGAGSRSSAAEETNETSSARDAMRQEEEGSMSDDRLNSAAKIAAAAAARSRAQLLLNEDKKAAKRKKALDENRYHPTLVALEGVWARETKGAYPKWGNQERRLVGDLVKRSDEETVSAALRFSVRYWDSLVAHLMGPKKTLPLSVSTIFRNAETILMLAKRWNKHSETWRKVDAWRAQQTDEYAHMPYDMELEYDEARQSFATSGFKI